MSEKSEEKHPFLTLLGKIISILAGGLTVANFIVTHASQELPAVEGWLQGIGRFFGSLHLPSITFGPLAGVNPWISGIVALVLVFIVRIAAEYFSLFITVDIDPWEVFLSILLCLPVAGLWFFLYAGHAMLLGALLFVAGYLATIIAATVVSENV
jgi:hypothetical protein